MKFTLTAPSFLSGLCLGLAAPVLFASRIGPKDSAFLTPEERDLLAMRSDWELVGESLKNAIQEYDHSASIQNPRVALQEHNHSHGEHEENDTFPTSETASSVSNR